ncbi:MAG: TrkA family potassium uptake protein [Anaerolineales bacterium]
MKKYIIVGCGRVGTQLAYRLFKQGHTVTIIDQDIQAFNRLPADFRGRTIEDNVLGEGVLQRAGIEQADGLAAVTNSDTVNAVVGHVARNTFGLSNVIVRNYRPEKRAMMDAFGLQYVNSTAWGSQKIEEMLFTDDIRTIFSAGNGEIEMYEILISSEWQGKSVRALLEDITPVLAVALTRSGTAFIPAAEHTLQNGDVLTVAASLTAIEALHDRLKTASTKEA